MGNYSSFTVNNGYGTMVATMLADVFKDGPSAKRISCLLEQSGTVLYLTE